VYIIEIDFACETGANIFDFAVNNNMLCLPVLIGILYYNNAAVELMISIKKKYIYIFCTPILLLCV